MDTNLLKSQIVLKNISVKKIVKKLEISESAYYRKMKGKTEFTRKEINRLIDILDLSTDMAMDIFFNEKVS